MCPPFVAIVGAAAAAAVSHSYSRSKRMHQRLIRFIVYVSIVLVTDTYNIAVVCKITIPVNCIGWWVAVIVIIAAVTVIIIIATVVVKS